MKQGRFFYMILVALLIGVYSFPVHARIISNILCSCRGGEQYHWGRVLGADSNEALRQCRFLAGYSVPGYIDNSGLKDYARLRNCLVINIDLNNQRTFVQCSCKSGPSDTAETYGEVIGYDGVTMINTCKDMSPFGKLYSCERVYQRE